MDDDIAFETGCKISDDERSRASFPPHLRRVEIVLKPDKQKYPCCMGALHTIGEERSASHHRCTIPDDRHRIEMNYVPQTA